MFGLDVGTSAGFYKSRDEQRVVLHAVAVPAVPVHVPPRTRPADMYFAYSLAGPTYISKVVLDGLNTGRHFTFQDFMGIGWYAGANRNLNLGVKINHYSNGNIFTQNAGVKIPQTFSIGYAF